MEYKTIKTHIISHYLSSNSEALILCKKYKYDAVQKEIHFLYEFMNYIFGRGISMQSILAIKKHIIIHALIV